MKKWEITWVKIVEVKKEYKYVAEIKKTSDIYASILQTEMNI